MKLIFTIMVIYQMTSIISESDLFSKVRRYIPSLSCFLCTSTQLSFLTIFWYNPSFEFGIELPFWAMIFVNSMFISGLVWFVHLLEVEIVKS